MIKLLLEKGDSMILKKPYGLLIKYFRVIHIILTLITVFVAVNSHTVLQFFRDFIKNGYTVTVFDNMAKEYISGFLYIGILLILGILLAMYILLKTKNKPNKTYLFAIIYYSVLFVAIIISSSLINGLSDGLWATAAARTYRDIAQIIYFPQYIFIIIIAIRALGFNVKQFNFKDDLKELEITEADSEEIELSINFQTYKAERIIRRFIREFYYYYLENKIIFNIIFCVIVVITVVTLFKGYEKLKYTYDEGESFAYETFNININDSLLTNVDLAGNAIVNSKYYLIIRFNIINNSTQSQKLDYTNFKLYLGNDYLYPSLDIGNYFLDYGNPYMGSIINAKTTATYIIPYILEENQVKDSYKLTLYTGQSTKSKNFLAKTINVNLKPTKMMDVEVVRNANLNENVSFSSTMLKDTSLTIKNVVYDTRYEYTYESCYKETCRTYTDLVLTESNNMKNQILLIMDYDFKLDTTVPGYQNIKSLKTFSNTFMKIEYTYNNIHYVIDVKDLTPSRVEDKLILQTDKDITYADSVNLLITIRNRCYKIKLK